VAQHEQRTFGEIADHPAAHQPGVIGDEIRQDRVFDAGDRVPRRGAPEVAHLDALGVHPAEDVTDGPVLAPGVQRLQAHQHAVGVLGGQPPLVVGQQRDTSPQQLSAVLLGEEVRLVAGIEILGQLHLRARCDPQRLDELRDPLRSFIGHQDPHPSPGRHRIGLTASTGPSVIVSPFPRRS
jgi:hypothetical protein